jgi:hypothetical protein
MLRDRRSRWRDPGVHDARNPHASRRPAAKARKSRHGSSVTGRSRPETRPSPAGPPDSPATHAHEPTRLRTRRRREAPETLGPDWRVRTGGRPSVRTGDYAENDPINRIDPTGNSSLLGCFNSPGNAAACAYVIGEATAIRGIAGSLGGAGASAGAGAGACSISIAELGALGGVGIGITGAGLAGLQSRASPIDYTGPRAPSIPGGGRKTPPGELCLLNKKRSRGHPLTCVYDCPSGFPRFVDNPTGDPDSCPDGAIRAPFRF